MYTDIEQRKKFRPREAVVKESGRHGLHARTVPVPSRSL